MSSGSRSVWARWQTLDRTTRIVLLCALAAVAACSFAALVLGHDRRVLLFSGSLRADQLAEVDRQLSAWGIAYALAADNVRVDPRRRSDLLLRLSLAGIPRAHLAPSSEALATLGALTPQAVLDAQAREGLENDLALALRGMAGVSDARVIVAPGHEGLFADERAREASASVRVNVVQGSALGPDTANAIRAFVAAGVPGLDAARVTVLDDRGIALDTKSHAAADGSVQTQLQSALDVAFGSGATVVRVHEDVDERRREIHDVRRTPLGNTAIHAATFGERYASDKKHYEKTRANEDRGSDVRDERTSIAAGAASRRTVAVFVDAALHLDVQRIRVLATAASGIDVARGDRLTVEPVAFARATPAPPRRWIAAATLLADAVPAVALAAFGIVLAWVGIPALVPLIALRRRDVLEAPTVARVRELVAGEPPHACAAILSAVPAPVAAAVLEHYGADERAAILRQMARPVTPAVAAWRRTLARGDDATA